VVDAGGEFDPRAHAEAVAPADGGVDAGAVGVELIDR